MKKNKKKDNLYLKDLNVYTLSNCSNSFLSC